MCWHKWGKWTTLAEKELKRFMVVYPRPDIGARDATEREDIVGRLCEQQRICEKCGMKKLRIEKSSV